MTDTKRISRLRNRISRNEKRLAAWKKGSKGKLGDLIEGLVSDYDSRTGNVHTDDEETTDDLEDFLTKYVAKKLDDLIEPDKKILIAARAAVTIYLGTQDRIAARIKRLKKRLAELTAPPKAPKKKASKKAGIK